MRTICLLVLAFVAVAHSQSVKSCGGPNDHFKNASFTVSPDPIDKHKPLTITAEGTMDELFTGGNLNVDLTVKALGIISTSIKKAGPYTLGPGLAAGPTKAVIGPFSLPSVPGSVDVSGQVSSTNAKGEPVFCVALNINLLHEEVAEAAASTALPQVGDGPISDCGSASDHLKNKTTSSSGGVVKFTGDLDESVASGEVDVDLEVKVSFFHIPIKTNVPFTISPAVPEGPVAVTAGPFSSASDVASPDISVKVDGNVKVNDANKQEIACAAVNIG